MFSRIIVFIFGSIVGSFLNVCIHRMPQGQSVVWPRSHCPKCKRKIPGYDNIPFLSYIILRGKCRFCRQRISLRYPLVELLTALFFVMFFGIYRLSYEFFFYTLFISELIVAAFIDIKHRIIPEEISIGGIIAGFILSSIRGFNWHPLSFDSAPLLNSLGGIIIGGGAIYLVGFFFDLVYFKILKRPPVEGETSSMGMGDVELLAMIGAFLGWQKALITFFIAPFLAIGIAFLNLLFKKSHVIPYGPFLALAAILSLLWGNKIVCFFIPSL
ncbi:MAG: prepilin peptidase [Candidatus Omnitrophota bacterium]